MKTHRSDFKSRFLVERNSKGAADLGSRVPSRFPEPRQRSVAAMFRMTAGLTLAAFFILVIWAGLTKPGVTTPSPSWRTALFLAEQGAQEAIRELRRMKHNAPRSDETENAGRTSPIPENRTFVYSNLKAPSEARGSCYVRVSEEAPTRLSISSTGIVHGEYRTLAQRTLHLIARRPPLFGSAVFARKGVFVAEGAEVQNGAAGRDETKTAFSFDWITADRSGEERLPLLFPPWGLPRQRAVRLTGGDVLTLSNSGVFPAITLLGSSRLIIDNDAVVHIAGPLILRGESRIVIRPGVGAVSLYINKDVMVEEGAAIVNLTQSALSLSIVGMEWYSGITLGMREPLYATVYAPNSAIRIGPGAYLCGSVCGDTVHVLAGTRVDYDGRVASLHPTLRPFEVVSCMER